MLCNPLGSCRARINDVYSLCNSSSRDAPRICQSLDCFTRLERTLASLWGRGAGTCQTLGPCSCGSQLSGERQDRVQIDFIYPSSIFAILNILKEGKTNGVLENAAQPTWNCCWKMMYCPIQLVFPAPLSSVYTEPGPCWSRLTMLPFRRWTEGQRALASLPGLKRLLSSGGT